MDADGGFSVTLNKLAEGTHAFTVVASDALGNTSNPFSAGAADLVDTKAPVVTVTQSVSGGWTSVASDTIAVSAADATSGVKSVEIYGNGADLGAASLVSGSYVYTAASLSDGTHTFTAVATDNAGNATTQTLTDLVDAKAPVVTVTQSVSGGWTSVASDTIAVSAADATSGVKSVEIYGNGADLGAVSLVSGSYVYTAASLSDGTHTFTAVATDNAGNATTQTLTDFVDTTAPAVTVGETANGAWTSVASDTISGKVTTPVRAWRAFCCSTMASRWRRSLWAPMAASR